MTNNPGTDLVPFNYNDHPVRAGLVNDELLAVRNDVCAALGLADPSSATRDFTEEELMTISRSEGVRSEHPF
jgi:prophage antirepressor-like protein